MNVNVVWFVLCNVERRRVIVWKKCSGCWQLNLKIWGELCCCVLCGFPWLLIIPEFTRKICVCVFLCLPTHEPLRNQTWPTTGFTSHFSNLLPNISGVHHHTSLHEPQRMTDHTTRPCHLWKPLPQSELPWHQCLSHHSHHYGALSENCGVISCYHCQYCQYV